tara:strand:- start:121 stop:390 length:270 start_codon:yes stop_codon:yes gene_type:complete
MELYINSLDNVTKKIKNTHKEYGKFVLIIDLRGIQFDIWELFRLNSLDFTSLSRLVNDCKIKIDSTWQQTIVESYLTTKTIECNITYVL